ncbi:hypothetical protein J7T55_014687 [Diaporthe amygdali]|uniref:uncharacterized protein n=1 Tax=Phomopsis amygdali TaxID=1214568 RepID=UPI0022FDF186|nr:uncharacterized protein J7T55_014687 [Diaporthe amygdali]KAJ0107157.1 hypothetical protein J7T55_014687 [Diaporthe amygdali]
MSSHRGSQRSGVGSQRGFDGSQRSHGEPNAGSSGSQTSARRPLPVGTIEGQLYRHPKDPKSTLNRKVLTWEDEYQKTPNLSSLSLSTEPFPNRPDFGKRGKPILIWSNYFELLVDPRLVMHQYKIEVQPTAVGRKLTRIIELFLQRPESIERSDSIFSDFKSLLFSRVPLDDGYTACNIVYRSEFEEVSQENAPVYHLRLQLTKILRVRQLIEYLTSTHLTTAFDEKHVMIQAFNVFLNHYAKSQGNLVTLGSKTFPKDAVGKDLGGGLLAIRGFFSSVRVATGRLLVNVNRRPKVPQFGSGPNQVQFWFHDQGRYVTVSEFFYRSYGIRLNRANLPVVNVGSKEKPVYLPPEVCEVEVGQKVGFKLNADQTSRMISHSVRRPAPAHNALSIARDGLPMVGMSQQTNLLLDAFHIKVDPTFTSTPGRILTKPRIAYGNNRSATVSPSASWNLRGLAMSRPATIPANTWGWLYITMNGYPPPFQSINPLQTALEAFRESLRRAGINIGEPSPGSRQLHLNNVEDPSLEDVLKPASERLQMIYIILPAKNTPLYNRIKHLCDVKLGIINICSVGRMLLESNGRPQYFGNVSLKFNLKAGGDNQLVDPSRLHFISQGNTMIVGIDVAQPGPGASSLAPSVAAMVSNSNGKLGQFLATSCIQKKRRQEMIDGQMLKDHLNLWKTEGRHTTFPQNILICRDGVSEGQYQIVKDQELSLLRKACEEMYDPVGQQRPRITIVIVTKRHNTRFGPTTTETADGNGNCLAGTVTDRGITEAQQWDLWLQAHSAIQGAARPAHYFVVHDEIFRAAPLAQGHNVADTFEDVMQSLHYIFGRCTRAVSYATPAYYADIVCERACRYLSFLFDPSAHSDTASLMSDLDDDDDDQRRARLQELITPHPRPIILSAVVIPARRLDVLVASFFVGPMDLCILSTIALGIISICDCELLTPGSPVNTVTAGVL